MKRKSAKARCGLFLLLAWIVAGAVFSAALTCEAAVSVPRVGGVKAVPAGDQSVEVTWKDAKGVTGYQVYRSTEKNGGYRKVATVPKNQKLMLVDKKLATDRIYYYKVRAYYKKGSSVRYGAYSKAAGVKPAEGSVISAVTSVNYNTVNVKWNPARKASGYYLYKSTSKNGEYTLAALVPDRKVTSVNVTDLTRGRVYYFKVVPYRMSNYTAVEGTASPVQEGYAAPEPPQIAAIEMDFPASVTLNWNPVPGSSGYFIYRSKSLTDGYTKVGEAAGKNTKTFTDNTVAKGATYYYKMSAYCVAGSKKQQGGLSEPYRIDIANTYTISPDSEPYTSSYANQPNYDENTKQYAALMSYMRLFERIGGGTLTLKAGTYSLWDVVYIPSNTTIRFEDGVTIKSTAIRPSNYYSLFVFAAPSDSASAGKYREYNGVHDVKLLGQGRVVFDKGYTNNSAILIGHTKNILIDGITFQNMDGGTHFIELDASMDAVVQNCTFTGFRDTGAVKEAINIDVPDKNTGGFGGMFSSMDGTANNGVVIRNNVFENLGTAIGTHMYTDGSPHRGIKITGNTIRNCKYYGIRAMNWQDSEITGNVIDQVTGARGESLVIEMRGVSGMNVSGNTVSNSDRFMVIKVAAYLQSAIDSHPGLESYKPVYNSVTENDVVHNTLQNIKNKNHIYFANTLNFSDKKIWSVQ